MRSDLDNERALDAAPKLAPRTIEYLPPVNLEAEEQLIAVILKHPRVFADLPPLEADYFVDQNIRLLWVEITALLAAGLKVTPAELVRRLAPEATYTHTHLRHTLAQLQLYAPNPSEATHYAELVRDAAERRKLLEVCDAIAKRAVDVRGYASAAEVAQIAVGDLSDVAEAKSEMEDAAQVADRIINRLGSGPAPRYSTGLRRLDRAMGGGIYGGKVYGFQARKKTGKTTLLTTLSYNLITGREPVPHAFVSLEGQGEDAMQTMMARYAGYNVDAFRTPPQDSMQFAQRLVEARNALGHRGLMFRHRPRMSLDQLRAFAARVALEGRLKGIILDYFQLVTGKKDRQSQVEHLDDVAQTIADSAANTGLWWIVAAQINRQGELRGGDGLLMACAQAYSMGRTHVAGPDDLDPPPDDLWLEMTDTRYTAYMHLGNEENPVLAVRKDIGPYVEER